LHSPTNGAVALQSSIYGNPELGRVFRFRMQLRQELQPADKVRFPFSLSGCRPISAPMSVSRARTDGVPRPVPRVRLSLRVALAVTVALGLAAGARALLNAHQQAQRNHAQAELRARYLSAQAALAKLMPADVTSEACEDGSCGVSKLNPQQMAVQIKKVLPGSKIVDFEEQGCPGSVTCQARVEGRFDGFEAEGVAWRGMLLLPVGQTPPRGAIEWHPRRGRHQRGSKRLFFLGTSMELFLRKPSGLHSEE
jgi:hypothetical protein